VIDDLDLKDLRKIPRIGYYFRYELHRHDFHELTYKSKLRGHYAAKPLYGQMTSEGRVDTSGSFNGNIATLFVPISAKSIKDTRLFITHTNPATLTIENGKKNWKVINGAAERYIKRKIATA
jgi:hypothetical protein